MLPSGSIFYQDAYLMFYLAEWDTVGTRIDITSIIMQPYVWGEEADGYVRDRILYRRGIITVHRQILQPTDDGYEILAEGVSQYIDYIQMSFPCGGGPSDPFAYHINCSPQEEIDIKVTDGPHWADPEEEGDDSVWGDVDAGGTVGDVTGEELAWIDVWSD